MKRLNCVLTLGLILAMSGCDQDTITKDPAGNTDGPSANLPDAPQDAVGGDLLDGESASVEDAVHSSTDVESETGDTNTNGQSEQQKTGAPEGFATITFSVDDSANKTYSGGQMRWTGSFAWDEASNTIEYASSWLPEDGPYPFLYDDGPISEGGHEREGAVAGDHIFTTEVYVKADEKVDFEYGLLNEFDNWIWIGPNGMVSVEAGSTDITNLPGMTIPAFGDIDCKLTLNINEGELNDAFTKDKNGNSIPIAKVFVKGTMNSWAPVQLLDNGSAPDEVAGDGVYTYHHLESLGPHDGGLSAGGEVQFVFMLGVDPEGFAEDASEYKAMGDALPDGVKAYTDAEIPGVWSEVPVVLSQDSKGNTLNTAFVVPGGAAEEPECSDDNMCEEGLVCVGGICSECASSVDCNENEKCAEGKCELAEEEAECEIDVDCGEGSTCENGACVEQPAELIPCDENGECSEGYNCTDGLCIPEPPPVSEPDIFILTPTSGSKAGGTTVSVIGEDFQEGAMLSFGGNTASDVVFVSETELTCKTPAAAPGIVDVEVVNPDGGEYTFAGAFTFTNEGPPPTEPTIKGPVPAVVAPSGGTAVAVKGWVLENVATVKLDGQETEFEWVSGTPTFAAPAASLGDSIEITVVLDDGTELTSPKPLRYGHVASPQIDGVNSPDEWPYLLSVNAIPTSWGDNVNELSTAWAAYDETNLYIAFEAFVEKADGTPSNALVVYLDRDFGAGTGVSDCNNLGDKGGSGDLDHALSGGLVINVEGFGADLAAGTVGTNSVAVDEFKPLVGWRMLDNLTNFGWIQGTVESGTDGWIEMAIPYSVLFSDGQVPVGGTTIGAFAVIGNKWGSEYSNQSLPSQELEGSTVSEAESVMTFELLEME